MAPLNPESIRASLRLATLKECLAWSEHTEDDRIRDALRPLLFDPESGAIRHAEDQVLREELFQLAQANSKEWQPCLKTAVLHDPEDAGQSPGVVKPGHRIALPWPDPGGSFSTVSSDG